jgi:hypothetical protein
MDIFNAFNRANVDEVSSVYGSPAFCGAIPGRYKDATTLAIQAGTVSCAAQIAATVGPVPLNFPGGAFIAQGLLPVPVPGTPNKNFGQPRTTLNPRQLQFSAKFSF